MVVTGQHDQVHIWARRGFHDRQGAQHINTIFSDIDFWLYLCACRVHAIGGAQYPVAQRLMDHAHRGVGLPALLMRHVSLVPVEIELRLAQSSKCDCLNQFRRQWRHPVAYLDPYLDQPACEPSR